MLVTSEDGMNHAEETALELQQHELQAGEGAEYIQTPVDAKDGHLKAWSGWRRVKRAVRHAARELKGELCAH